MDFITELVQPWRQLEFRKRLRQEIWSSATLHTCNKRQISIPKEEDPFNRLTDDIIVSHILSRLSFEEVVRCSVLSRRWEKLWSESIGSKLIFSYYSDWFDYPEVTRRRKFQNVTPIITQGISNMLETCRSPFLDEFIVRYGLHASSQDAISSWIECAFRKGVKRLELDFLRLENFAAEKYTFPSLAELTALHTSCDDYLHQPVKCSGMYNLRDVCFIYVNVSAEVIQFMLSNCASLERLCVWMSNQEMQVNVSGQSVMLRSLEIVDCPRTKINISSPSLLSLRYSGSVEALSLMDASVLSELHIAGYYCLYFLNSGFHIFGNVSQLKRLTLSIDSRCADRIKCTVDYPSLINLEQLELKFFLCKDLCQLWPIGLIKAAPVLQKFTVQVCICPSWSMLDTDRMLLQQVSTKLKRATEEVKHQRLKCIVVTGFRGCYLEMVFVRHFLGISKSLEQLVISPFVSQDPPPVRDVLLKVEKSRELAQQLTRWLLPTTQLVVL